MKKFIKPEITSVELSSVENIMASLNMVDPNGDLQAVSVEVKKGFDEWQGLK